MLNSFFIRSPRVIMSQSVIAITKDHFWALVSKKANISLYGNVKKAPKNQVAQQGTSRHCEGYSNPRIHYIKEGI